MSASAASRWLVLAFVSLAMFGNYYAFDALNPVGPLLESQLGFSQAQIGLLDSAYNVAALLVLIAGGVIIDRAGTKRAMVLFGSIAFVGAVVMTVGGSHLTMAAGRFVMGVGAEPMIVAATAVLGRWFKGKELGFAMGVNLMIARFGSVAADNSAGVAPGLVNRYRWEFAPAKAPMHARLPPGGGTHAARHARCGSRDSHPETAGPGIW